MKSSSKAIKNALFEIRTNISGLYQKADTKTAKGYIDTVVEYCDEHIQKLVREVIK